MKRFLGCLIIITAFSMLFMSCEKPPSSESNSEVEKTNKQSDGLGEQESSSSNTIESSSKGKDNLSFVTIKEAKEEAQNLAGKKHGTLTLPKTIRFPDEEVLYRCEISQKFNEGFEADLSCIKELWADYDIAKEKALHCNDFEYEAFPKYKVKLYYDDEKEKNYIYKLTTGGQFVFNSIDSSWQSYQSELGRYDIGWGDIISDDEGYELLGGYMSVNDAISMVETKLNSAMDYIENDSFVYKVQQLSVGVNSVTDTPDYYMIVGREYEGTAIDSCMFYYNFSGNRIEKYIFGDSFLVIVHEKDKISCINIGMGCREIEKTKKIEKIISLEDALDLAEKEIATVGLENIEQAGLVYYCVQEPEFDKEGSIANYGISLLGEKTSVRPYWVFAQKKRTDNFNINASGHGPTILVDALDGSVYYFDTTA